MSTLRLEHTESSAVGLFFNDRLLCRYVYQPTTAAKESPKPYFHPVNSLAGDTLTNFRPNDHPWHHALSFTLNNVSGANFWGGPTCLKDGYKWRDDHGAQHRDAPGAAGDSQRQERAPCDEGQRDAPRDALCLSAHNGRVYRLAATRVP